MSLFSKLVIAAIACAFSSSALATSALARVDYLGQTRIEKSTDEDTIVVRSCDGLDRKVSRIKLKFTRNPATLYKVKIKFGDGSTQIIRGNQFYRNGETTGWMDMMGGFRCIHKVQITANGAGGASIIELYGETIRAN